MFGKARRGRQEGDESADGGKVYIEISVHISERGDDEQPRNKSSKGRLTRRVWLSSLVPLQQKHMLEGSPFEREPCSAETGRWTHTSLSALCYLYTEACILKLTLRRSAPLKWVQHVLAEMEFWKHAGTLGWAVSSARSLHINNMRAPLRAALPTFPDRLRPF